VCTLLVAVAWSFSGGVEIRYIVPVLWMTSCFLTMALWRRDHARARFYNKILGQIPKFIISFFLSLLKFILSYKVKIFIDFYMQFTKAIIITKFFLQTIL